MDILIATLVVGLIGLLIGVALVFAGRVFHVEVDERETAVRDALPGNNCGACGFAGCDAMAAAIVKGEAPVNACPVCSPDALAALGSIMGVEASAAAPKVAFVRCSGDCEKSPAQTVYVGIKDCRAASLAGVPAAACKYGCMGLGSCVKVCAFDAISVVNGVAKVDPKACVGCGMCVNTCPLGIIQLTPVGRSMAVRCVSKAKGPEVRKVCSAGCIGCGICVKQCEFDAVTVDNFLAHIDPEKCTGCGKCAEKCPAKVIVPAT